MNLQIMGQNYNLIRVFRRLLRELVNSDDTCRGDRILVELAELVPNVVHRSLALVNKLEFYCTKPVIHNDNSSYDLDKQLFTFYKFNEEHQTLIGFCSCKEYLDSVLIDETSPTCEHELAMAIACYLCRIYRKNNIQMGNCDDTHDFILVQKTSLREYINLLKIACNNNHN
ncbi:hypothetical protein BMR1_02g02005 [Babesia microti strain RI]|uniref:SWIM-type domain-containing protein n=1 Tax=Babesia microti (strain RI) TaxID=1133968 RepID=A0A1R4AAB9_BABMR|nr:hypothetical protein BMR1_02g02005 [Babesia microti strain RI]SJK85959.1 hypothetical protein BMR1_02g02005 [Babesia microti strain RI]|eukprot:XP_021338162.1 hypothetical protein BMR1_02g02005 [Babesia microti strain RI]